MQETNKQANINGRVLGQYFQHHGTQAGNVTDPDPVEMVRPLLWMCNPPQMMLIKGPE